jgi:hypothetical protein
VFESLGSFRRGHFRGGQQREEGGISSIVYSEVLFGFKFLFGVAFDKWSMLQWVAVVVTTRGRKKGTLWENNQLLNRNKLGPLSERSEWLLEDSLSGRAVIRE